MNFVKQFSFGLFFYFLALINDAPQWAAQMMLINCYLLSGIILRDKS